MKHLDKDSRSLRTVNYLAGTSFEQWARQIDEAQRQGQQIAQGSALLCLAETPSEQRARRIDEAQQRGQQVEQGAGFIQCSPHQRQR
eukprot:1157624-Pelagomonas_calceolata.AAC.15